MKRIAIIALTFVLAGSIMTGCRRNDMTNTTDTGTDTGSTTITTVPDVSILPQPTTGAKDGSVGTDPTDGSTGNEGVMPRGRIDRAG
ncbi:MAG: hypothetical protein J6K03_00790 [Oscillospiraceae bacterium]|nr:hypothetical protein [Oscillospiraceae bacterium]